MEGSYSLQFTAGDIMVLWEYGLDVVVWHPGGKGRDGEAGFRRKYVEELPVLEPLTSFQGEVIKDLDCRSLY